MKQPETLDVGTHMDITEQQIDTAIQLLEFAEKYLFGKEANE